MRTIAAILALVAAATTAFAAPTSVELGQHETVAQQLRRKCLLHVVVYRVCIWHS